jgi:hypothetical protein
MSWLCDDIRVGNFRVTVENPELIKIEQFDPGESPAKNVAFVSPQAFALMLESMVDVYERTSKNHRTWYGYGLEAKKPKKPKGGETA